MRGFAFSVSLILSAGLASSAIAQGSDADALARARAVDACNGRPVVSATMADGNRVNVVCGEGGQAAATNNGSGLGPGGSAGLLIGALLLLGLAAGGGGSAGGT